MSPDYVPDFSAHVLPYVKWYQDDFIGGVRGMRAHEVGIYTILLMEMYARGRALDLSDERLARLCGADKRTFSRTLQLLIEDGKIVRLECGLWNERCENAFRERAKMQERQSSAGRASAEKRSKNKGPSQRLLNARSTPVEPISEAQNTEGKEDTNVSSKRAFPEQDFEDFYRAYPRHVGKGAARRAYATALKKISAGELLTAAGRFAADVTGKDPKFIPYPATWLNAERWGDDPVSAVGQIPDDDWSRREAQIYAGVL